MTAQFFSNTLPHRRSVPAKIAAAAIFAGERRVGAEEFFFSVELEALFGYVDIMGGEVGGGDAVVRDDVLPRDAREGEEDGGDDAGAILAAMAVKGGWLARIEQEAEHLRILLFVALQRNLIDVPQLPRAADKGGVDFIQWNVDLFEIGVVREHTGVALDLHGAAQIHNGTHALSVKCGGILRGGILGHAEAVQAAKTGDGAVRAGIAAKVAAVDDAVQGQAAQNIHGKDSVPGRV